MSKLIEVVLFLAAGIAAFYGLAALAWPGHTTADLGLPFLCAVTAFSGAGVIQAIKEWKPMRRA